MVTLAHATAKGFVTVWNTRPQRWPRGGFLRYASSWCECRWRDICLSGNDLTHVEQGGISVRPVAAVRTDRRQTKWPGLSRRSFERNAAELTQHRVRSERHAGDCADDVILRPGCKYIGISWQIQVAGMPSQDAWTAHGHNIVRIELAIEPRGTHEGRAVTVADDGVRRRSPGCPVVMGHTQAVLEVLQRLGAAVRVAG